MRKLTVLSSIQRLLKSARFWLFAALVWLATLFTLSSFSKTMPEGAPSIPFIDKILHFGYFFGGGIILATYLLLKRGPTASLIIRLAIPLMILAVVGALDEYRQTFTPGRSGNDPWDWLADILGAAVGILFANRFHPLVTSLSFKQSTNS